MLNKGRTIWYMGGGGCNFSQQQVFSLFFAQQVIIFKSKLQLVFYFLKETH